jgi:lipopolysaccharide export LptBFGC system permease protein LptF
LRNFKTPINNILKGEKYPELKDEYNVAMAQNLPKTFTTVINDIVKTHEASVQDSEEQHQEITEDDEDVSNEDMGETEVLRCENNQLKLQVGRLIEEKKRMKHHMMRLIKVVDDKEAFVSFVHDLVGEYM